MRGFRWQLLALMVSILLFAVALVTRVSDRNESIQPTASPGIPTQTITPTPDPTTTPAPTAAPVEQIVSTPEIVTYREGLVGSVQRLNPLFADLNPVDLDITALIFEGLTRINAYGEIEPALAREWVTSFDGLEYVVTLRDDVLWQDGVPFTAADVVYTMSILSSQDFPGSPELSNFWQTVETEQINDYLVRFRLVQPLGTFLDALRIGILPAHALQGTNALQLANHPFNLSPIGTGPYQLEALRGTGDQIQTVDLQVAPVYRQRTSQPFAIERIRFQLFASFDAILQAFERDEIDGYAARNRSERLTLVSTDLTLHTTHAPDVGLLIFNWVRDDLALFREQRVRQALMVGLNRDQIIQRNLLNAAVRADSPISLFSWAYNGGIAWPSYNVEAAKELLSVLNVETTEESSSLFSFSILTIDEPALVNVAQEIATQWSLLDIDVTVDAVDLETYRQRLQNHEFDAALVELSNEGSADPDVYSFWHQGQYPDGKNYGGTNDRVISEALERARRDYNGTNRKIHYDRFQQAFIERAVAIPLYYPLFTYAMNPNISDVQMGFIGSPADRFLTIGEWSFDG